MDELALRRQTGTLATTASFLSPAFGASNICYFPQTKWPHETPEGSAIVNLLIGNVTYENYLKEFIEGTIMSIFKTEASTSLLTKDNPFDPIYLAQLQPDLVFKEDVNRIEYFASRIIDISDEIFFDDGWDD